MPTAFEWPGGIECAVSLTYDDGLPIHTVLVGPTLERYGLRGTFYTPTLSDLHHHPDDWRSLAAAGHELGNHTVFHPCRRLPPEGYTWLEDCYDLSTYSPSRLRAELNVANFVLNLIDGQTERTYGNTCCNTTIGRDADEQSIEPILADLFVAARGVFTDRVAQPGQPLNLLNVGCQGGDGRTLAELRDIVDEARTRRGWAVLMIHGVGPETHKMHMDREVHHQFVAWLAGQQQTIWTAPFREVAHYVASQAQLEA
jgi:peptidoglycan-N-acetylglucosamine deacetylase